MGVGDEDKKKHFLQTLNLRLRSKLTKGLQSIFRFFRVLPGHPGKRPDSTMKYNAVGLFHLQPISES